MLTVIDEYTRECLAIEVDRHIRSGDVLHVLTDLFTRHGAPDHIRSDNGAGFTAKAVRDWLPRGRSRPSISNRDPPGRTDTTRASTASCATRC